MVNPQLEKSFSADPIINRSVTEKYREKGYNAGN